MRLWCAWLGSHNALCHAIQIGRNKLQAIRSQLCQGLDAIQRGDMRTNYLLQSGDIIYVPSTVLASIGYALQALLFPFSSLFAFGSRVSTTVFTGGAGAAL